LIFDLSRQRKIKDELISKTLMPLFIFLKRNGVSAHFFSVIGFIFHLASVFFFLKNQLLFVVFFGLFLLFDGLDGTYARSMNSVTEFGGHLDRLLDGFGGLLFYLKAFYFFNRLLVVAILFLYLVNYFLMYFFKLEKKIGIARNFVYFSLFGLYQFGLWWDLAYFLIFCPLRIYHYQTKR